MKIPFDVGTGGGFVKRALSIATGARSELSADELSAYSLAELDTLSERIDATRHEIRRARQRAVQRELANRPAWVRSLASVIDGPGKKKMDRYVLLIATAVVLFCGLPGFLQSCIEFGEKYQQAHRQGAPAPTAPTIQDERQ